MFSRVSWRVAFSCSLAPTRHAQLRIPEARLLRAVRSPHTPPPHPTELTLHTRVARRTLRRERPLTFQACAASHQPASGPVSWQRMAHISGFGSRAAGVADRHLNRNVIITLKEVPGSAEASGPGTGSGELAGLGSGGVNGLGKRFGRAPSR